MHTLQFSISARPEWTMGNLHDPPTLSFLFHVLLSSSSPVAL